MSKTQSITFAFHILWKEVKIQKVSRKHPLQKKPKNTCPLAIAAVKMSQLFQGGNNFQNRISKLFNDDRVSSSSNKRRLLQDTFCNFASNKAMDWGASILVGKSKKVKTDIFLGYWKSQPITTRKIDSKCIKKGTLELSSEWCKYEKVMKQTITFVSLRPAKSRLKIGC